MTTSSEYAGILADISDMVKSKGTAFAIDIYTWPIPGLISGLAAMPDYLRGLPQLKLHNVQGNLQLAGKEWNSEVHVAPAKLYPGPEDDSKPAVIITQRLYSVAGRNLDDFISAVKEDPFKPIDDLVKPRNVLTLEVAIRNLGVERWMFTAAVKPDGTLIWDETNTEPKSSALHSQHPQILSWLTEQHRTYETLVPLFLDALTRYKSDEEIFQRAAELLGMSHN